MMIRLTSAFAASLLCLALAGCEVGSRDSIEDNIAADQAAATSHGQRRGAGEAATDDPITRAREQQEAAAAREVAEAQLQAQNDAHDAQN